MEFIGFLFVVVLVLLIIFMAKVSSLSGKLTDLDRQLKKLTGRVDQFESAPTAGGKKPKEWEGKPAAPKISQPPAGISPAGLAPVPRLPEIRRKPSRTREEWESLIGGKVLNRIGALALIIGIGYFLKYAFDNNWIGETTRVLIGGAIGFLCLVGAYRSHQKGFNVFAQGIVGAGISILYLSVYASFNFYSLVPQWVAFVLMSIVTVITLGQGLYYNSIAVGLFGWAGGFLTPFLLSTGVANETGLFAYVALLDAGLLAIVFKKEAWWVIEPLTFAGTWILYGSWYDPFYTSADLGITLFFVGLFWALFYALAVVQPKPTGPRAEVSRRIVGAANAWALFLALYAVIDADYHKWTGLIVGAIGVMYLATLFARAQGKNVSRSEQMYYVLTSIGFVALASTIQWKGFEKVVAWCVEAGFLVWISSRLKLRYIWLTGAGIFAAASLQFISTPDSLFFALPVDFTLLFHSRALALLVAGFSILASAWSLGKAAGEKDKWLVIVFQVLWPAAFFLLIGLETNDLFRHNMVGATEATFVKLSFENTMWIGIMWTAYSVLLVWAGLTFRQVPVLICGLTAALIGGMMVFARGFSFEPVTSYTVLFNIRAAALLVVAGLLLLHERLLESGLGFQNWISTMRSATQMAIVLVIFGLLTGETRDIFRKQIALLGDDLEGHRTRLSNLEQLSLSGIWLAYSVVLMAAGLWRKLRALRIAAFVLFGFTILKIFLYDLSFLETLYRIFSFVGLGLVLLGVSYAYQRYRDVIFGTKAG